jgi:hypothetical protein
MMRIRGHGTRAALFGAALTAVILLSGPAAAAVIEVFPGDGDDVNMAKIEGAEPGDEVVVAPGTYRFRLYLEAEGTAGQPVVIRAADPGDRPVWDLEGDIVANWPGTYTGGDRGRAIWQITGSYYFISGIVFRNGTDGGTGDSGGLRFKASDNVTLHDCLFQYNDNGIQGSGTDTVVEFCEFDRNGLPGSSEASHNLYIQGGTITVRYCYIHDPRRSQNIHIRATYSLFEYNWIARAASYMGDMMPCTMDPCDTSHTMVLRGNVILRGTPLNDGQVFVMYNDQGLSDISFELIMTSNTIIGNGDAAALVHFGNENSSNNRMQTAVLDNNVIYNVARVFRVDDSGLSNWSASGTNNWLGSGTADTDGLAASVTGADPGFADAGALNFVPAGSSPLLGAADSTLSGLPDKEYYRDETVSMQWRPRLSVSDIGAFEHATSTTPVGPYDDAPPVDEVEPVDEPPPDAADGVGDVPDADAPDAAGDSSVDTALDGAAEGDGGGDSGCGCTITR